MRADHRDIAFRPGQLGCGHIDITLRQNCLCPRDVGLGFQDCGIRGGDTRLGPRRAGLLLGGVQTRASTWPLVTASLLSTRSSDSAAPTLNPGFDTIRASTGPMPQTRTFVFWATVTTGTNTGRSARTNQLPVPTTPRQHLRKPCALKGSSCAFLQRGQRFEQVKLAGKHATALFLQRKDPPTK